MKKYLIYVLALCGVAAAGPQYPLDEEASQRTIRAQDSRQRFVCRTNDPEAVKMTIRPCIYNIDDIHPTASCRLEVTKTDKADVYRLSAEATATSPFEFSRSGVSAPFVELAYGEISCLVGSRGAQIGDVKLDGSTFSGRAIYRDDKGVTRYYNAKATIKQE